MFLFIIMYLVFAVLVAYVLSGALGFKYAFNLVVVVGIIGLVVYGVVV